MKTQDKAIKTSPAAQEITNERTVSEDNAGCPYCSEHAVETETHPFQNCIPDYGQSLTEEQERVDLVPRTMGERNMKALGSRDSTRVRTLHSKSKFEKECKSSQEVKHTSLMETVHNKDTVSHLTSTADKNHKNTDNITTNLTEEINNSNTITASTTRKEKSIPITVAHLEEPCTVNSLDVKVSTSTTRVVRNNSQLSMRVPLEKNKTKNDDRNKKRSSSSPTTVDTNQEFQQRLADSEKINKWSKKPPYYPRPTITSRLRYQYWFDDCGRRKVKAFHGDWSKFPQELEKDWDVYVKYCRYRRRLGQRTSSLVKKIVNGKLSITCPDTKTQQIAGRRSFLRSKYRQSVRMGKNEVSPLKRFQMKRRLSRNKNRKSMKKKEFPDECQMVTNEKSPTQWRVSQVRRKPKVEVADTITSKRRKELETEYCPKSQSLSFWPHNMNEMQDIQNAINKRRRRSQKQCDSSRRMNKLMVLLANSLYKLSPKSLNKSKEPSTSKIQSDSEDLKNTNKIVKIEVSKNTKSSNKAISTKPKENWIENITIDIPKVSESKQEVSPTEEHSSNKLSRLYRVAKWMMPPTIPIQHSLTSSLRQNMKDQIVILENKETEGSS